MSDEQEDTGTEHVDLSLPYQVVLIVGMTGDIESPAHVELITKMTVLMNDMRTRFPEEELPAAIKDYIMSSPERQI